MPGGKRRVNGKPAPTGGLAGVAVAGAGMGSQPWEPPLVLRPPHPLPSHSSTDWSEVGTGEMSRLTKQPRSCVSVLVADPASYPPLSQSESSASTSSKAATTSPPPPSSSCSPSAASDPLPPSAPHSSSSCSCPTPSHRRDRQARLVPARPAPLQRLLRPEAAAARRDPKRQPARRGQRLGRRLRTAEAGCSDGGGCRSDR